MPEHMQVGFEGGDDLVGHLLADLGLAGHAMPLYNLTDPAESFRPFPYQDPLGSCLWGGHGGVRRDEVAFEAGSGLKSRETKMRRARPTCRGRRCGGGRAGLRVGGRAAYCRQGLLGVARGGCGARLVAWRGRCVEKGWFFKTAQKRLS